METYTGRLACDGDGNLLADERTIVGSSTIVAHDEDGNVVYDDTGAAVEISLPTVKYGKNHGRPVAHDPEGNRYIFVEPGESSHNDRHHQQFVVMEGTVDEGMTDDESLVNAGNGENMHHFAPTEDDPHYSPTSPGGKRLKNDPDRVAATATGHTEAYTNG